MNSYDQANVETLLKRLNYVENRVTKVEKRIEWLWPICIGLVIGMVLSWFLY
jgi:tetrahydromethanopterin S-methyltransferase subunit G